MMYDDNYIKRDLPSSSMSIMNHLIQNTDCSLGGSFVGKVVDNNDPDRNGRCKILVYNVFDTIPDEDLPWAIPEFSFIGSNLGSFIIPTIGTIVKVEFMNGEINIPIYSTKILNINKLPTNKDKSYPDNMVFFETDSGDSFELDRSNGDTIFTHRTGTTISISPDGSINAHSENKVNITHKDGLFVDGLNVTPEGIGPLCALPTCLFTGAPHTGRTCSPLPNEYTNPTQYETTEEEMAND